MSDEVAGRVSSGAPDVPQSAAALLRDRNHYEQSALPIPPRIADMIVLTQNLASIVVALSADIHSTFATPNLAAVHYPQVDLGKAA